MSTPTCVSPRLFSALARRRFLTSCVAGLTALAAFASTSCAAPRWPAPAGYPLRTYVGEIGRAHV